MMCDVAFSIPNEVLYDTKMSKEETVHFARAAVAMAYYVKNGVSLGYCAEIAGMDKESFIKYLSANGVSIYQFDDENEFLEEMQNA